MPKTRNLPVKTYTLYGMGRICTHINGVSLVRMYTVSQKVSLLTLDNNFGKCGPIFKSLSPADSQENSTSPAICWYYTLWKSKIQKCYWFWQHPQQTVDMLLRTLWGLDLTFDSNLVRQTVSRLRTLTDWLTDIFNFVRQCLPQFVQLNVVASWWFFWPWLSSLGRSSRKYVYNIQSKYNKLSYYRETARRFVSLNILLSHQRSLKVIRNSNVE